MNDREVLLAAIEIRARISRETLEALSGLNKRALNKFNKFASRRRKKHGENALVSIRLEGTGIGTKVTAICELTGKEKDITDYDCW